MSHGKHLHALAAALLTSLAFLPVRATSAADWQELLRNDKFTVWVDAESLMRQGDVVQAWEKFSYRVSDVTYDGKRHQSFSQLTYYDCRERRMAAKSRAVFSGENLQGDVVDSAEWKDDALEWEDVLPESLADVILMTTCAAAPT